MAAKILIKGYVVGMIQTNVYFLYREGEKEAVLVDPADHGNALVEEAKRLGLKITAVLLTHAHFDHIGGVKEVVQRTGAKVYISELEKRLIHDTDANLSAEYRNPKTVEPDVFLRDGETVMLAGMNPPILLSGDTLFEESVGRTDFPTGSMSALVRSVKERLFALPDDTLVYPGHGGMTQIGHEKQFNAMV